MSDLIHAPSVGIWIPAASRQVILAGEAHEKAEQAADESYDQMMAPPCPACGKPVKDKDWERHRRVDHADSEVAQPAGKPDARELLLLAYSQEDMERKLTIWRSRHPGIRLEPSGDGTREEGKIVWRRWRIFDGRGKPAQ